MQVMTGVILALIAVGSGVPPVSAQPTFDCGKAQGQVEQLICGDERLQALDRRLSEVYAAALKKWPADVARGQRAEQRGWIKGRNDCWKSDDVRGCVTSSYRTRTVELQIKSGQLMAPTAIGYRCRGAEGTPLTASFYQQSDPPTAVITYGDDQVLAFLAPSGSRSKYTAANVEFWEHHGEAKLTWFGTSLTCQKLDAPSGASGIPAALGGTAWTLVRFQSMDDITLTPEPSRIYSVTFNADGSLLVRADCNRGRGGWKADGGSLALGPIAMTRAMCPPSALENRFVRDLDDVRSFVFRDGQLHLTLMADGGIYSFEPSATEK